MSCNCPAGYTPTPAEDGCVKVITASTIGSPSTITVVKSDQFIINGYLGTVFFEDITNLTYPIRLTGTTGNSLTKDGTLLYNTTFFIDGDTTKSLKDRTLNYILGGPGAGSSNTPGGVSYSITQNCTTATTHGPSIWPCGNSNTVWGNRTTTLSPNSPGRLNYTGVWATTSSPTPPYDTWRGFSACFDNPTTQTYYIGMGGDDFYRFKLNGVLLVDTTSSGFTNGVEYNSTSAYRPYGAQFSTWSVFPITLLSGPNFIEMEGCNNVAGSFGSFGAEIYSGSVATLSAMTLQSQLSLATVFSSRNLVGSTFDSSGDSGYTCPDGYVLVTCSGSPFCSQVLHSPCITTGTTSTTTTTTRPYINAGYIPVNDCDVLTIQPLNVQCSVTNITDKPNSSNGSISLNITGGVPPYTIRWTYPNGTIRVGSSTINGLSAGDYTATVTDNFGDYTFTTTCTVPGFTTTTTSTTTKPSIPNYLENLFCMTIELTRPKSIAQKQLTFQLTNYIGGYKAWISDTSNEIVYFDTTLGTSGAWSLSASSISDLNTNSYFGSTNWQIFNSSPGAPIPQVSPNFTNWVMVSNVTNQSTTSTLGVCSKLLYLTFNEWWGLNASDIPTLFKFFGICGGGNVTPWMKWYLQGGLTSSDISSYEILCTDLDAMVPYIHWNVTGIDPTQTEISSIIPWIGSPTINIPSGGVSNSQGWEGPCPPVGETHTYEITLTANLVAGGTLTSSVTFTSST